MSKKENSLLMSSILTEELFSNLFAPISNFKNEMFGPATNILDKEDAIYMQIVIPGIAKEHLKMTIENRMLTVSFEKNAQSNIDAESYLRREFAISNFSRSFKSIWFSSKSSEIFKF